MTDIPSPQPAQKWEGAEEWMPLAWELCANECGEEACTDLIWEGGPIPEPWGDRWLKYEDQAKEMIAMVRKHVPAAIPAPEGAPLTLPPPDTHCWDDDTGKDVWSYSADLVRSIVSAALAAPAPQAPTQEPAAWLVLDRDGSLIHAAAWREAAHDHINDAISEHGISEAARWVVRPAFIAPQTKEPTNDR